MGKKNVAHLAKIEEIHQREMKQLQDKVEDVAKTEAKLAVQLGFVQQEYKSDFKDALMRVEDVESSLQKVLGFAESTVEVSILLLSLMDCGFVVKGLPCSVGVIIIIIIFVFVVVDVDDVVVAMVAIGDDCCQP